MPDVYGAVMERLAEKFGGFITERIRIVVSAATAGILAERDPERVVLIFVNVGTAAHFISPLPTVSSSNGIRLAPTGGLVAFNVDEDATLPSLEWWLMSEGVAGNTFVIEVRREALLSPSGKQFK